MRAKGFLESGGHIGLYGNVPAPDKVLHRLIVQENWLFFHPLFPGVIERWIGVSGMAKPCCGLAGQLLSCLRKQGKSRSTKVRSLAQCLLVTIPPGFVVAVWLHGRLGACRLDMPIHESDVGLARMKRQRRGPRIGGGSIHVGIAISRSVVAAAVDAA